MTDAPTTRILECPYCLAQCQFTEIKESVRIIAGEGLVHAAYYCAVCDGLVTVILKTNLPNLIGNTMRDEADIFEAGVHLEDYNPKPRRGKLKSRINLSLITNKKAKEDFQDAIKCYDSKLYNACMIMARRAIQQEMLARNIKGDNLHKQIEKAKMSENFKNLLHKIKNFGNHAAHPDFYLYDSDGKKTKDKKKLAKLSIYFLALYFMDVYEIDSLINESPKTKKELKAKK